MTAAGAAAAAATTITTTTGLSTTTTLTLPTETPKTKTPEFNLDPFEVHEFTDEDDAAAAEWQQVSGRKLTKMCRAGVPEYFRGGVWNKVASPTMHEAGTPSHKVRAMHTWTM